jgi:DNA polymerase-3 subunit gamma/tau
MLGSSDTSATAETLRLIAAGDAAGLIRQVRELHEYAPSFESLLLDLAVLLQQIAVVQMAGVDAIDEERQADVAQSFANDLDPETVQLFYQIAITGARDLALAPDPLTGFEMALLRMLAFAPDTPSRNTTAERSAAPPETAQLRSKPAAARTRRPSAAAQPVPQSWPSMLDNLALSGAALEVARHCELVSMDASLLKLRLSRTNAKLLSDTQRARIRAAVQSVHGAEMQVDFEFVDTPVQSTKDVEQRNRQKRARQAADVIAADPNVKAMIRDFGATLDADSVKPAPRPRRRS